MLSEVRKRIADPHATLDGFCALLLTSPRPAKRGKATVVEKGAGRHVRWRRGADYECVKPGLAFANAAALDAAWAARAVTLEHVYLMRHHEADVLTQRSQLNPLWEALYYLSDERQFVRVQKKHLHYLYQCAGRTDKTLAWSVREEEVLGNEGKVVRVALPYWPDRHAFSVLKIK